jgi:hypothetical protein
MTSTDRNDLRRHVRGLPDAQAVAFGVTDMTSDIDGATPGVRPIRRILAAIRRRRTNRSINAVTRTALERDGFDLGPVTFRDGPLRRDNDVHRSA